MGALFLPGTYLASVFSMTFFDFGQGSLLTFSLTQADSFANILT
jgi:hypothetical protein